MKFRFHLYLRCRDQMESLILQTINGFQLSILKLFGILKVLIFKLTKRWNPIFTNGFQNQNPIFALIHQQQ